MIFEAFYPCRMVDSVWDIDYEKEAETGFRAVLFDIDNTLVPHDAPATEKTAELFRKIQAAGLQTCVLSNNDEPRVKSFADRVGSPYVFHAGKPKKTGYERAAELLHEELTHCLFVGDQLLTDILGANRAKMENILVKPVDPESDLPRIRFKRKIEKIIMRHYYRKHPAKNA